MTGVQVRAYVGGACVRVLCIHGDLHIFSGGAEISDSHRTHLEVLTSLTSVSHSSHIHDTTAARLHQCP